MIILNKENNGDEGVAFDADDDNKNKKRRISEIIWCLFIFYDYLLYLF